jgi:exosortase N
MIVSLSLKMIGKKEVTWALLILAGLAGAAFAFPLPYLSSTNLLMGLCILPFSLFIQGERRKNYVYLVLACVLGALTWMYGVRIFYFYTLAFYALWLIELLVGRCNPLILFQVIFMSPIFSHVTTIASFPIRIILSEWAGAILRAGGVNISVQGNVMLVDNASFSVDEACMGLNMLAMSMLMATFLLAHRYRTDKKKLNLLQLSAFFASVFLLNLLTNLFRIMLLVIFRIAPANPLHECVGVLCLLVYVMIPVYFIGGFLVRKCGRKFSAERKPPEMGSWVMGRQCVLAVMVLGLGFVLGQKRDAFTFTHAFVNFEGLKPEPLPEGITKISSAEFLLYVKPIPEFFTGEHSPLICWKGSGYNFSGVSEQVINGTMVYSGKLVKEGDVLYTAWWFTNGRVQTISQFDWRMRTLRGEDKFCLINITAQDEATLISNIKSIFTNNSLQVKYGKI